MKPECVDTVEAHRRALNRLKRARGQLNAVIEHMEQGAPCREVVTQLAAVSSALDRAGFTIIATAMRHCLTEEEEQAEITTEELEKLFLSLA